LNRHLKNNLVKTFHKEEHEKTLGRAV
jgi:hypothetical protein